MIIFAILMTLLIAAFLLIAFRYSARDERKFVKELTKYDERLYRQINHSSYDDHIY